MPYQPSITKLLAHKHRGKSRYRSIKKLAVLPTHQGRKVFNDIGYLLAPEIDMPHRWGWNIRVNEKREELRSDLRINVDSCQVHIFRFSLRYNDFILRLRLWLSESVDEFPRYFVSLAAMTSTETSGALGTLAIALEKSDTVFGPSLCKTHFDFSLSASVAPA